MTTHRIAVPAPMSLVCATRVALGLITLLSVAGCKDILDVENPNNVAEASLVDPTSAEQQANGVLASAGGMLAVMSARYATATDELDWIGSRDGWRELERG